MPRRKSGSLLDLELKILIAGLGVGEFYGYDLAKRMEGGRPLVGYGSLYKALGRLENMSLVSSRWEAAEIAELEGRPRRRLYQVTGLGVAAEAETRRSPALIGRPAVSLG